MRFIILLPRKRLVSLLAAAALLAFLVCYMAISRAEYMAYERSIQAMASALLDNVVVIDPGHGGRDPGCIGVQGTREKDVALAVAFHLREMVSQAGGRPVLLRDGDYDLADMNNNPNLPTRKRRDLEYRVKIANSYPTGILVSIHCNSIPSQRWYGAQVFYYGEGKGKLLAQYIQKELNRISTGNSRQALQVRDKYIVKNSVIPAVIVEVGFLSNPREERLLNTAEYRRKMAFAIFGGIARYCLEQGTATPTLDHSQ